MHVNYIMHTPTSTAHLKRKPLGIRPLYAERSPSRLWFSPPEDTNEMPELNHKGKSDEMNQDHFNLEERSFVRCRNRESRHDDQHRKKI